MAVDLTLEGSQPQRRSTVAFRIILAIPHWLFASVLSSVAFVVVFFAWFAVLFTARMPKGMGDFLARILQYQARVYAYGQLLLTDAYPPFDIGPAEYPVMLELDEPGRFNRAAVLFRFFLQLPALALSQLVTTGATVILFFVWLVTLVAGQMPASAYLALSSILRYQLRTWAYMGMLTTEYPRGLWGDRDAETSAYTDLSLPSSPRIDRLVLNRGAKVLVTLSLLFGLGWFAFQVSTASYDLDIDFDGTKELATADGAFQTAYDTWLDVQPDCRRTATAACTDADRALRLATVRYASRLDDISLSSAKAVDEQQTVGRWLQSIADLLARRTETTDPDELLSLSLQVQDTKVLYDKDFEDLFFSATFD